MSKRTPRIATARQGAAFDGVFDASPAQAPPAQTPPEQNEATSPSVLKATPPAGKPDVPEPGDADHDRTVQANWNVPAWLRAKVRAIKDQDGLGQNEVVAEALARYVAEREQERGEAYSVQARHFR